MTFRIKINLLVFAAIFVVSVVLLSWFSLFTINEALTHERFILRDIAREMDNVLSNDEANISELNTGLKFVHHHENAHYKVWDKQGKVLASRDYPQAAGFVKPVDPDKNYLFKWSTSWLQHWYFNFYYSGKKYNIAIYAKLHMELRDALWPFFLVSLILMITLSFAATWLIAEKILQLITKISLATTEVANGNFSYRIPVSNSQDEVSQLELDLNHTFSVLESSFSRITEFSSEVAHEMRTPLTVILGNLEVAIRQQRSAEDYQQVINETIDEIRLLCRLVDDMLLLLRPAAAYHKESFSKIDVAEILIKVIEQLSFISELKNIKLAVVSDSQVYVSGIESLLSRICFNLIHNAIKFSDSDSTVKIELKRESENMVLTVVDEGIGIKSEDFNKVFSRFYRSQDSTGQGLGLPMAKQLVEVHGGTIALDSEYGKGSCFTVKIRLE